MRALAWIALAFLVGVYICQPIRDADLWWHIAVGRWIVAHGEVPSVDLWNIFGAGSAWRAYSWSNEVVYALVANHFGDRGLMILQMALAVGLALVAQLTFSFIAGNFMVGAALGAYGVLASYAHFALRPQSLVWGLFILVLGLTDRVARQGSSWRSLAWAVLLGAVWANTHLSAVFGLVAVLFWAWGSSRAKGLVEPLSLAGSFILGTLITPYLGGEWLTLLADGDHVFDFSSISEFGAASFGHHSTVMALLGVVLLLVCYASSGRIPSVARFVMAGLLLLAGLVVVKLLPFAVFAICALLASWWRESGASSDSKLSEGLRRFELTWNRLQSNTIGAVVFVVGSLVFLHGAAIARKPIDLMSAPAEAVDFVQAKGLSHPVLNEFSSGGYLIYRWSDQAGVPQHLVAIDGRTNVYPAKVWQAYRAAYTGSESWRSFFDLVKPKSVIWRKGSALNAILLESPEWCRVFDGGESRAPFVVFITKDEFESRRSEFNSSDCL